MWFDQTSPHDQGCTCYPMILSKVSAISTLLLWLLTLTWSFPFGSRLTQISWTGWFSYAQSTPRHPIKFKMYLKKKWNWNRPVSMNDPIGYISLLRFFNKASYFGLNIIKSSILIGYYIDIATLLLIAKALCIF